MPRVIINRRHGFEQVDPAITWTVVHNLNLTTPVVDVWIKEGGSGPLVNNDAHTVTVIDASTVIISFSGTTPVSGTALIT